MVPTYSPGIETTVTIGTITIKLKISAYVHLYGPHEYNALPFVPIVMEALIHKKTARRKTFAEYCKKVYVLGTSFEHYQG